jgi:hypothetical protein
VTSKYLISLNRKRTKPRLGIDWRGFFDQAKRLQPSVFELLKFWKRNNHKFNYNSFSALTLRQHKCCICSDLSFAWNCRSMVS